MRTQVGAITLWVEHPKHSEAFYQRVFGLAPIFEVSGRVESSRRLALAVGPYTDIGMQLTRKRKPLARPRVFVERAEEFRRITCIRKCASLMLLQPTIPSHPAAPVDIAAYEEQCFSYYSACARDDLHLELEAILELIVRARRILHAALTNRKVDEAHALVTQLLHLESQAAALRRLVGDVAFAPPVGAEDRRPQRRRTARE